MPEKKAPTEVLDKDFLATFARGLEVIKSFDTDTPSLTLTELAKKNGLSRASARRFLLTLQKLGYVTNEGTKFSLTAKILDLGYSYLSSLNFAEVITPFLERVTQQLGDSCSATVLDGQEVVYIARIPRRGLTPVNLQIGARLPAYATSAGRVLLASLTDEALETVLQQSDIQKLTANTKSLKGLMAEIIQVRKQGFAIVDQELELEMRAAAVPVYDRGGNIRFAMNLSTHISSYSVQQIEDQVVPVMLSISSEITKALP